MKELKRQPEPKDGGEEVYPVVLEFIKGRVEQQEQRYGQRLKTNDGRDSLYDALQEAIDTVFYITQAIMERDNL